ncbi:hypothetical protein CRG98_016264 [Punica granatum]|uniref:Uncharacterized protein n=1 Tax=Punica granatum TaxID=22663 RepID=A0A2I0K6P8_PUNGR|nr:hypothetical protein CRG98_016264 [Punica granatum]
MAELDHAELVVIKCLLVGVGEDVPGLGDEPEGLIREGEVVALGVEEEGKAPVVVGDELDALGEVAELEDGIPIGLLAVDEALAGEEGVDHREHAIGRLQPGVRLAGPDRKALGPMKVARGQELLRRREPPLRLRSSTVHYQLPPISNRSLNPHSLPDCGVCSGGPGGLHGPLALREYNASLLYACRVLISTVRSANN